MKINAINSLVALLISLLLAYAFWSLDGTLKNYVLVGSFFFLVGTLIPAIGITHESQRVLVNLRVLSGVFFAIALAINGIYSMIAAAPTAYIILSALLFVVYLFIANTVTSVKQ